MLEEQEGIECCKNLCGDDHMMNRFVSSLVACFFELPLIQLLFFFGRRCYIFAKFISYNY